MILTKGTLEHVDRIADIYEQARRYMRIEGNTNQWSDGHPNREDAIRDISDGNLYVCLDGDEVVGCCYFWVGTDKTYGRIDGGEWLNDREYGTIHRMAVKYHGRGIARFMFDQLFAKCGNIRIDTHRDNKSMKSALAKSGFVYCGIIYIESGDMRDAYQKIR